MEYKKVKRNNLTLHLINSDRFKTMNIVLFFSKEYDKKDIVFGNLLTHNLVYSTKKYNSKNKIAAHCEDLFGSKVVANYSSVGKLQTISFSLDFVNPRYTEKRYMDESLDLLYEIVFNPNINNNCFNEKYFNIIKNDCISYINSIKTNPSLYAGIEYSKEMYKGTPSASGTIPELKDLDKVNPKNLYDFYKRLFIGEYKVDIVAIGELDDDIIDILFNKFGNIKSSDKKLRMSIYKKYDEEVKTKIDVLPFNQSKLYLGYRLINMDFYELNYVLRVYNTILGTMNDNLLFNIVRENNSLCYSINSYVSKYNPSLTIYAGINKDNYEKSVSLIKKCVELMSDKKTVERLFDSAKQTINTYLNNYYDDVILQINNYYDREFERIDDIEEQRKIINNVSIDEVIKLNEKIKLSTIYLMKGEQNSD